MIHLGSTLLFVVRIGQFMAIRGMVFWLVNLRRIDNFELLRWRHDRSLADIDIVSKPWYVMKEEESWRLDFRKKIIFLESSWFEEAVTSWVSRVVELTTS
jgi:hypothetical protein